MIDVVVYGFHPTPHEISLVPKSGSPGVFQEVLPPDAMRFRARPPLEGFEIAPILAHAEMGRKQTEEKILVKQHPSGFASTDCWIRGPKPIIVFRPRSMFIRMPR